MKKFISTTGLFATVFILMSSCNLTGQQPMGVSIIGVSQCFVPVDQFQGTFSSRLVYSDAGQSSNTPAALNITNTACDGRADYYGSRNTYIQNVLVKVDVNQDGNVDVITDAAGQIMTGIPIDYNTFISIKNGRTQPQLYTARNGVTGYLFSLVHYGCPQNYRTVLSGDGLSGPIYQVLE